MTDLDKKIRDVFPEESIFKTPIRYNIFAGVNLPSFIKDWLIKRYSDERENIDKAVSYTHLDVYKRQGMELPCTLELMQITEQHYRKKFPEFKLEQAESNKAALDMWKEYGPPSRVNRWCCSVLKTALFGRKMKEILEVTSQPRLLVFEGVRNDESSKRAAYNLSLIHI